MPTLNKRRQLIVDLALYLVTHGKDEFGPVHMAVTEGRAPQYAKLTPRSTSCGDLGNLVMFAAGCRSSFVNRTEHRGWTPGRNLSVFLEPRLQTILPRIGDLKAGDLLCYDIFNPKKTHLAVFLGLDEEKGALTADFGQPGGRLYECKVGIHSEKVRFGAKHDFPITLRGRPLHCSVNVDLLDYIEEPITLEKWLADRGLPNESD